MKKVRNTMIRVVVMIAVFIVTILFVNKFENRQYENLATEMEDSTLPLAYIRYDGEYINCMHGYTSAVDLVMLRDSITPVDENKSITVAIDDNAHFADSYAYELRSIAGNSLIENGDLEAAEGENGFQVVNINIRMDIEPEMEYMLVIRINGEDGRVARYYTRLVINADYHAAALLEFVHQFNRATYDFEMSEEQSMITPYMETYQSSHTEEKLSSLGHINLNSDYRDITWANLRPMCMTSLVPTIKEIDVNYAVIELDYKAMNLTEEEVINYYSVKEFYRVSYGEEEITLMNFDRYVDEYFNRNEVDVQKNIYEIGIMSDDNVAYRYSTDNKKLSFVRNGQLWLYDYSNNRITMVFGFWLDDVESFRNTYDNYDINIIAMDDNGNMDFAVYGYMNRAGHEGKLGISLYHFQAENLELTELLFVENNVPYSVMKRELSRLTYYDGENFYFMLGDKINCVRVADRQMSYFVDEVSMKYAYTSDNMEVLAYCDNENQTENRKIHLVNLKTGNRYVLTADAGCCLVCYGFQNSDFIYGECRMEDGAYPFKSNAFSDGTVSDESLKQIPAEKICIVNDSGQIVKEYRKEDYYVVAARLDDDLIYLTRAKIEGQQFVPAEDDFITFKEDEENPVINIDYRISADGYGKWYFTMPDTIYLTYIPRLTITKNKMNDDSVSMVVDIVNESAKYMVYDNLGLNDIYELAGDAINAALDISGIVISQSGEVIYRESESLEYNTIASAVPYYPVGQAQNLTLQACIYMTLGYQGAAVTFDEISAIDCSDPAAVLTELGSFEGLNISGLGLDMAFRYVGDGIPVIGRIDDGRYVMIVSYNSEYIRYYDPVIGDEVRITRSAYEKLMEPWDNEMYTYFKE